MPWGEVSLAGFNPCWHSLHLLCLLGLWDEPGAPGSTGRCPKPSWQQELRVHPGLGMGQEQPPAPGRGSPAPWGELAPKGPPRGGILVTLTESGRAGVLWLLCSGTSRSLLSTAGQTPAPRNKPFQGSQPGQEQGAGLQGWGRLPKGKSSSLSIHIELPSFLNPPSAAPNSFVLPVGQQR